MIKRIFSGFDIASRNIEAGNLFENFFISAIATVLFTRFYLAVTGYPTIGGSVLHISHLIPGSLLMFAALFLLLGFLSRQSRYLAAFIGGIGFGLVIDETGKFITRDNDYFYQPAIAVIYLVFVLLLLLTRAVERRVMTEREYTLNALEITKEVILRDLDEAEKRRAIGYLEKAAPDDAVAKGLATILAGTTPRPGETRGILTKAKGAASDVYQRIVKLPYFPTLVTAAFVTGVVLTLGLTIRDIARPAEATFTEQVRLVSVTVSILFVFRGLFILVRKGRAAGYRALKIPVLISILVTHVFLFAEEQLAALAGLSVSLLVLLTLNYSIEQERRSRLKNTGSK